MHYYQFTIINGFNGWVSCRVERYKRFLTKAQFQLYFRRLQRGHSWVSATRVSPDKYRAHTR